MFGEVFYLIDPNSMILGLLFLIFFVFIQFALHKALKDKMVSVVIAFCASLLTVYGLSRSNLDLGNVVFRLGISENIFYMIVPWIALGLLILASFRKDPLTGKRKFRLSAFLFLLGVLLIATSFLVYEQAIVMIAGAVCIILSLLLWLRRKKKEKGWSFRRLKKNSPVSNSNTQITKPSGATPQLPGKKEVPKTRRPMGVARFDLIIGGQTFANPEGSFGTMDLRQINRSEFYIKNGGTGGILSWKAAASKGLSISPTSGKLSVGRSQRIELNVTDRNINFNPHVTIFAKRGVDKGARNMVREAVGKAILPFKVKLDRVRGSSRLVDRYGNPI